MDKKVKLVMIGTCPNCGKELKRKLPVDLAVCECRNPDVVAVPLSPALLLPNRVYAKWSKIAALANIDTEMLINKVLEEAARRKLRELKPLPQITITTKDKTKQKSHNSQIEIKN